MIVQNSNYLKSKYEFVWETIELQHCAVKCRGIGLYVKSTTAYKLNITNTHKEEHINVRKWNFSIYRMECVAGDSLTYSNKMKFSTVDQDNDKYMVSCSTYRKSAWWFNNCALTDPNGQYTDSEKISVTCINWYTWKNSYIALKKIQLMIRPQAWQCVKVLLLYRETFYTVYLHTVFNVINELIDRAFCLYLY